MCAIVLHSETTRRSNESGTYVISISSLWYADDGALLADPRERAALMLHTTQMFFKSVDMVCILSLEAHFLFVVRDRSHYNKLTFRIYLIHLIMVSHDMQRQWLRTRHHNATMESDIFVCVLLHDTVSWVKQQNKKQTKMTDRESKALQSVHQKPSSRSNHTINLVDATQGRTFL